MSIRREKEGIIASFRSHESDTGSSAVQIALLTDKITSLNDHLKENPKDYSSQRGLMKLVGLRHRLSAYLRRKNPVQYSEIIVRLGLRK